MRVCKRRISGDFGDTLMYITHAALHGGMRKSFSMDLRFGRSQRFYYEFISDYGT